MTQEMRPISASGISCIHVNKSNIYTNGLGDPSGPGVNRVEWRIRLCDGSITREASSRGLFCFMRNAEPPGSVCHLGNSKRKKACSLEREKRIFPILFKEE